MDSILRTLEKRLKPKNGLVVNEETWAAAHDYHLNHQRAHLLLGHGAGIISGFEVKITDKPAQVSIKPGMAVDSQGRIIVLAEGTSLTLSTDQPGLLYIYVEADDEREKSNQLTDGRGQPIYVYRGRHFDSSQFRPPAAVELARVRLSKTDAIVRDPGDPNLPGPDELDHRFRAYVGHHSLPHIGVAIIYLGQDTGQHLKPFGLRAKHLAGALSHLTRYPVHIDDDVKLAETLPNLLRTDQEFSAASMPYTLLYVVEQGAHLLQADLASALLAFHRAGGTLFVESYHEDSPLFAFWAEQNVTFQAELNENLLTDPFLFAAPPAGANPLGGKLRFAEGLLFSTCDYGNLWQRGQNKPREVIRAATEWGANLITYALTRQRQVPS